MFFLLDYLVKFLVGCFGLTLFFYILSYVVPKAIFIARSLATYSTGVVAALYGATASILLACIGKRQIAAWACARAFHFLMKYTTGVQFAIDDPKDLLGTTRPAIFISNHQTELDILMLGAAMPKYCSITAKSILRFAPFLGLFMMLSGTVFIDRGSSKDARSAMDAAAREIKTKRQSVFMFAEGTRSHTKDPTLLPFKKGAFHLAVKSGVPIVPCVVANYSHIFHIRGRVFNAGTIPIKVLDPIPVAGLTAADVDELARSTHELMLKELIDLSEKTRR